MEVANTAGKKVVEGAVTVKDTTVNIAGGVAENVSLGAEAAKDTATSVGESTTRVITNLGAVLFFIQF